jgi:NAD(P)-dependent dehydrogenase (short-subunit alcohol dehydrogenase family)
MDERERYPDKRDPGQVALVTGASSGIGEAAALELAKRGYVVYAAARRAGRLAGLTGRGIHALAMDVADDASMQAGLAQVIAEHGRIDVLVNNAGYGSYGALEDVDPAEARYQFEVNVFGLARLIQLIAPHMRAQGSGRIVNISSMGGKIYEPLGAWYHATKFAVEGLSDSLRLELKPFGIDVVIVEPGAIRTEWADIAADKLEKTSGGTVYADQAGRVASVLRAMGTNPRRATDPAVVGRVIAAAATSRRPRTRYVTGFGARPLLLARRLLPDRSFDRVMTIAYRRAT